MLLLPAIDLMDGEVVRLRQGRAEEKTVYSREPAALARRWQEEGGDYLHVVDLDAAFTGRRTPRNRRALAEILASVTIPVELGGGIRDEEAIREMLDLGVSRVVVGTRAAESMEFVGAAVRSFGSARIVVGIDAKDGMVAVKGWTQSAGVRAADLALQAEAAGVGAIIYTDIATDGMLGGPNFSELDAMLALLTCPLIASGGISTPEDLRQLAVRDKLYGAIIGRALYDNTIQLPEYTRSR